MKAGQDKYCVDFQRIAGDALDFYEQYKTIKEELDLDDAVY